MKSILIVGSGNAALCAGISALEHGADVLILEAADEQEAGGNSKYTAGAMRFVYNADEDIYPLLLDSNDKRLKDTEFGSYTADKYRDDLQGFNDGAPLSLHQNILIDQSYETIKWLASQNVKFEPIYDRQSFLKNGKHIFWGGLTLAAQGEGVGLVAAELKQFLRLGGKIKYNTRAIALLTAHSKIIGVKVASGSGTKTYEADKVILACGGFEASPELRKKYMGPAWEHVKVRGTKYNTGAGIKMAIEVGASFYGITDSCHAVPMDKLMLNYGNDAIPHLERKKYRKICYFLGIMLNAKGHRFVDEGINFRNYTYAQFGKAILNQPGGSAWQIFDSRVEHLLYDEYRFWDAHYVESETIEGLVKQMDDLDKATAIATISTYNEAVNDSIDFDPSILDGKSTQGLDLQKSNWANKIDTPPFKAFPVTCGITFTYGGLHVNKDAAVLDMNGNAIESLYACGELVGGVFYYGYPGGSGLTSGAVFGRIAGRSAALS